MPSMTGLELLFYMAHVGIHIPTIIMTAYDEAATREQCISAGASVYLLKPIRKVVLMAAISDVIKT